MYSQILWSAYFRLVFSIFFFFITSRDFTEVTILTINLKSSIVSYIENVKENPSIQVNEMNFVFLWLTSTVKNDN